MAQATGSGDTREGGPRGGDGVLRQRSAGMVEDVARELEEDIALGRLHPRERLVEDTLIERFGAKRHVVRSALASLEARGAVERRANVGAFVRSYSAKEVRDLYDVRELLEVSCARAIEVPLADDVLAPLEEVQREHDRAVDAGDRRGALRANLAFHEVLFGLAGNQVLVDAVRRHARMASPIRSITVTDDAHLRRARDEHRGMIRALRDGDTPRLVELCTVHLQPSRDAYLRRIGDG
ncbi:GntR family transcriptional regulator [Nocardioides sp. CPCC 205120]|uniref:GntR family transcriptional regulator n=1 Tax=Nocardioides sp. CPCC 205120 TaxID=3406462 RepID=UPI003B506CC2